MICPPRRTLSPSDLRSTERIQCGEDDVNLFPCRPRPARRHGQCPGATPTPLQPPDRHFFGPKNSHARTCRGGRRLPALCEQCPDEPLPSLFPSSPVGVGGSSPPISGMAGRPAGRGTVTGSRAPRPPPEDSPSALSSRIRMTGRPCGLPVSTQARNGNGAPTACGASPWCGGSRVGYKERNKSRSVTNRNVGLIFGGERRLKKDSKLQNWLGLGLLSRRLARDPR